MATYVTVANLAASKIGEDDQLRSPDDDTHIGRTVKAVWDAVRRAAIRDHTWNFAMRRKGLAAEALDDVPYPWAYSYPEAAESLRLVQVLNLPAGESYQLEGGSILCNVAGPLYVRYLVDVPEPARWDDLFVEAMACRLAFQIGPRIAGSEYDKGTGWKVYQAALAQAKRVDARENPQVENELTDWELARLGYTSGIGVSRGPTGNIIL